MEKIKISVIVPVYNREKLLKRCLDSIINQTLKEIEIIVVNDGSTDNSEEIIKSYKDSRIVHISKNNEGISVARNTGINMAQGEYISFIDSDDWIDLDFLEKLYNSAQKYNADLAVAGIIRIQKFHKKFHLKFRDEVLTNDLNKKFELCEVPNKSYVWNKIYKTSKLKEFNLDFEPQIIYEDVIFTPKVLYYFNKLVTVPDTYYYYWRSTNSLVKQRSQKARMDSIYAHKIANDFIKEHNIDVSSHQTFTKRCKIGKVTIFKTKTTNKHKEYVLFNIIKWTKEEKILQ